MENIIRLRHMKNMCEMAAYKLPDGPMGNLYHEALMASIEGELIKDTPDDDMIVKDIENIRLAYCKLYNDLDKIIRAYSDEDEG